MKHVRDRIGLFQDFRSFPLQRERLEMNMELETVRRCVSKFNVAFTLI